MRRGVEKRARRARGVLGQRNAKRRRGVGDLVGGVREGVAGTGDPRARVASRSDARGHVRSRQGTSRGAAGFAPTRTREEARASAAPRGDAASGGDGRIVSRGGGGCAAGLEFGGEEDVGDASVALAVGAGDVVGVLAAGLGDEAGDGGGHGIGEGVRRGEEGAHERVRGGEGRTPEQGDAEQGDARARLRLSSCSSRAVVVGVVVFPRRFCAPGARRPSLLATARRRGAGAAPRSRTTRACDAGR